MLLIAFLLAAFAIAVVFLYRSCFEAEKEPCVESFTPGTFNLCMKFIDEVDPELKFRVVSKYSAMKNKPEKLAKLVRFIDSP